MLEREDLQTGMEEDVLESVFLDVLSAKKNACQHQSLIPLIDKGGDPGKPGPLRSGQSPYLRTGSRIRSAVEDYFVGRFSSPECFASGAFYF